MGLFLYFLRHGQTALSRDDTFCGSGLDPELTPEGLQMAQAFAGAYRETEWRAIYSSVLRRAITTAEPLCVAVGATLTKRAELNEIGYGQWEGMTKEKVEQQFHDDYITWLADPACEMLSLHRTWRWKRRCGLFFRGPHSRSPRKLH